MISLLVLIGFLFFSSVALFADTRLVCAIDMGSSTFKLILGEMKEGHYVQHHFTKNRLGVGDDMSKTGLISPPKLKGNPPDAGKILSCLRFEGYRGAFGGGRRCLS